MKTKILLSLAALGLVIASCSKKKDEPAPPTPTTNLTVTQLKAKFTGSAVTVGTNTHVSGIVISDPTGKNVEANTIIIQEATGKPGVVVHFAAAPTFALNDLVDIDVSGQSLQSVNGETALANIPVANAKKTGTGTIAPATLKISDLAANAATLDGTLVQISAGTFSGGNGNYTGSLTYKDSLSTATLTSNVQTGAAFAGQSYPVLIHSFVGIVRITGSIASVDIRNASEVSSPISVVYSYTEDFSKVAGYTYNNPSFTTSLGTWTPTVANGNHSYEFPLKGSAIPADASFLDTSKTYLYLPTSSLSTNSGGEGLYFPVTPNVTGIGLSTITITFASSNSTSASITSGGARLAALPALSAFDSSKDTVGLALCFNNALKIPPILPIGTPVFNQAGNFYTVTFVINRNIIQNSVGTTVGNMSTVTSAQLAAMSDNDFYTLLQIGILNISTSRLSTSGFLFAPVYINKIVFGYSKKPTWAP